MKKFAIFHCEARRELRKWSPDKFANTAKYIHQKYGFDIVFAGDKNDVEDIRKIQDKIPFATLNVAGNFTLSAFATLASKAKLFIGNESGPLHIATASKCKSLGLYGPGVPVTFYPWGLNASYIHHVLDCNPCDQIHCVRRGNSCMDMITELEVQEKISKLKNDGRIYSNEQFLRLFQKVSYHNIVNIPFDSSSHSCVDKLKRSLEKINKQNDENMPGALIQNLNVLL